MVETSRNGPCSPGRPLPSEKVRGAHRSRSIPFDLPVNPVGPRLVREAYAALRPDVVHVHAGVLSPFAFDGVRVATALRLPTAITWHCMLDGTVALGRPLVRRTRWAHVPAALSAVSGEAAQRVRGLFGARVDVVPNGIDVATWAPGAVPTPTPGPGATDRPLHLVATMRLAPRKRAVPLIDVVAAAARRLPADSLRLTLVGDGPARDAVRARVAAAGLTDAVDLRGRLPRDQVRATYADADVFLAPARLEAFGIAALEARTAGLAVLAHAGTGVGEFVTDGLDGYLVADDAAMTDAIVRLASDPVLLGALRGHARAVPPPFDWAHVLDAAQQQYARAARLV